MINDIIMIEYDKDAIVHPYITSYIRDELAKDTGLLKELREYAEENSIPIVEPETARFILTLARIVRPVRVLEIGTAIGYSSILLSQGLAENGCIITLEYNHDMADTARANISKAGLTDKISVVEEDAKDYVARISGDEKFDYIFLDGPKAHYIYMLDDCVRLLRPGGILVSDNVLYKGMTAEDSLVIRRKITIVKRLRKYIDALTQHPALETSVIPLGDGVALSVKKQEAVI